MELASPVVLHLRRSRLTLTVATLEGRAPSAWKKADRRWSLDRHTVKDAVFTKRLSPPILVALVLSLLPAFGLSENLYWDAYDGWADSEVDVFWSTSLAIVITLLILGLRRPTLRLWTTNGELFVPLSRFERRLDKRLVGEVQRGLREASPRRAFAPSFHRA